MFVMLFGKSKKEEEVIEEEEPIEEEDDFDMNEVCPEIHDIPLEGDAIVIIGDEEHCEPCKELSKFVDENKEQINPKIIKMALDRVNLRFPYSRVDAVPKVIFFRDGKAIFSDEGFGGGEDFLVKVKKYFVSK